MRESVNSRWWGQSGRGGWYVMRVVRRCASQTMYKKKAEGAAAR